MTPIPLTEREEENNWPPANSWKRNAIVIDPYKDFRRAVYEIKRHEHDEPREGCRGCELLKRRLDHAVRQTGGVEYGDEDG